MNCLGAATTARTLAFATASRIERDIIAADLPRGTLFATYEQLKQRYTVGRQAVREAARVVELRGLARMRRGRRGGLIVMSRPRDHFARMVGGGLLVTGSTLPEVKEARLLVSAVAARLAAERTASAADLRDWLDARPLAPDVDGKMRCTVLAFPVALAEASGNLAADLFARSAAASMGAQDGWETPWVAPAAVADWSRRVELSIVTAIAQGDPAVAARLTRLYLRTLDAVASATPWQRTRAPPDNVIERTRAGQVAKRVLGGLLRRQGSASDPDQLLGCVRTLCEQNGISRATAIQAVRILEATGVIVIKPGRHKGFFARPLDLQIVHQWLLDYVCSRADGVAAAENFERLFLQEALLHVAEESIARAPRHDEVPAFEPFGEQLGDAELAPGLAQRNSVVRQMVAVLRQARKEKRAALNWQPVSAAVVA